MNKTKFIQFLEDNRISFKKLKFCEQSKYQKNNYKEDYVGWEAWVYQDESGMGYLITQQDYEDSLKNNNFDFLLDGLK